MCPPNYQSSATPATVPCVQVKNQAREQETTKIKSRTMILTLTVLLPYITTKIARQALFRANASNKL